MTRIKYRFKSLAREGRGGQVKAIVERLPDLLFFDCWRSPHQKAWDEKTLSEEECDGILQDAIAESPQTCRSRFVANEMHKALAAIRARTWQND